MGDIRLHYPVYTLEKRLLLPANMLLSQDILESLASSECRNPLRKSDLLSYGSVKNDILYFIEQNPRYRLIFADRKKELLKLVKEVRLPLPVLKSLNYFKEYDFYTYRHILMVFALSVILTQDMITDYQNLIQMISVGPTHDFGKTCIPLNILKKKESLTHEEFQYLKHHTVAGYVLLTHYFQDAQSFAAKVARDHHEKRNGSGYPAGICLEDRLTEIVVVSDIYDALISPRPYRPVSYDNRTALEEITAMAERGDMSWEVVQVLVANNRQDRPHYSKCVLSKEKRGNPPLDNVYGIFADKDSQSS